MRVCVRAFVHEVPWCQVQHNAEVNCVAPKLGSPLHLAAKKNHAVMAEYLTATAGSDPNLLWEGESALLIAARYFGYY